MNLPLGKKSIARIELRGDPIRRVVELATLLEWLILVLDDPHSPSPKEASALDLFIESRSSYLSNPEKIREACQVRDRLVHIIPATRLPDNDEIENSVTYLRAELDRLADRSKTEIAALAKGNPIKISSGRQPLALYNALDSSDEIRELRSQVSTMLRNLDLFEGRRVYTARDKDMLDELIPRLERHHLRLGSDSFQSICEAMNETEASDLNANDAVSCLKRVANALEESLNDLLSFESEWRLSPGVIPLNAIRLEPDISTRIRLLVTLIEHQLAWIIPHISDKEQKDLLLIGPGALFKKLVEIHEDIVPDEQGLLKALDVRNRLVRVIPNRPPLSMNEVEETERTLWQTAYELRRFCYFEHAEALSRQPYPGARTKPLSRIRKIDNPKLRLFSLYERLEALIQIWEERNLGLWPALEAGKVKPSHLESLKRHRSLQTKVNMWDIQAAIELSERIKMMPARADEIALSPDGQKSQRVLETIVPFLEEELDMARVPQSEQIHFESKGDFSKQNRKEVVSASKPAHVEKLSVSSSVDPKIISTTEKIKPPVQSQSPVANRISAKQSDLDSPVKDLRRPRQPNTSTNSLQNKSRQTQKIPFSKLRQSSVNNPPSLIQSLLSSIKANLHIENLSYYSLKSYLLKEPEYSIILLLATICLFFMSIIIYTAISDLNQDNSPTSVFYNIDQKEFIQRYVEVEEEKTPKKKRAKIKGSVIIPICLTKSGKWNIVDKNITNRTGDNKIRDKAIELLSKWKFKKLPDGIAGVCSKVTIEVR